MNYWHIQMSSGLQSEEEFTTDEIRNIISEKEIIGTGEWKDKKTDQCKQFKEDIENGDIILVRNGIVPIALVKVIEKNIEATVYENEHKIKIIGNYNSEIQTNIGHYNGQTQGTLTRVANRENPTGKFIINWYTYMLKSQQMNSTLELLTYKKQIILQGPPGTGKTRLAKILAEELILEKLSIEKIDKKFIQENIKKGLKLSTPDKIGKEKDLFVDSIVGETINLKISTGGNYPVTFDQVLKCITEPNDPNPRSYAKGIIYFLKCLLAKEQCKLIQFHPAYSYEDFVRGITVKSIDGIIVYKTENKILAKIAKTALDNYINNKKEPEQLSKQNWINTKLTSFIELLSKELTENGKFALTGKGFVYEIEDDCFRYKGEDWATPGRINLVDLVKLIEANLGKTISELIIRKEVSVHAWYRTSYYLPILSRFFLHAGGYTSQTVPNELLKSYVLIIDEINRANLPAVLGELIYGLEYRDEEVDSMYEIEGEGNKLILPPNLYIIGTMNTADRSVGHIDYAIKRRFAFVDVLPQIEPVHPLIKEVFIKISSLFIKNFDGLSVPKKIEKSESLATDFRPEDLWIGQSYFICKKENSNVNEDDEFAKPILNMKLKYEIIPLLKEYIKDGILLETEQVKTIMNELISKDF